MPKGIEVFVLLMITGIYTILQEAILVCRRIWRVMRVINPEKRHYNTLIYY